MTSPQKMRTRKTPALAGAKKPLTQAVTRYECGHCSATFRTKKEADEHCVCKCGRLVETERYIGYGVSKDCEKCQTKSSLLSAKAYLRRLENDLVNAEKSVDRLETEYKRLKDST